MKKIAVLLVVAVLAIAATSCKKPPQRSMSNEIEYVEMNE